MATTKVAVYQLIVTYLATTPVTKLTVQEVLNLTSVSRTTFYRFFPAGLQEIYDLILQEGLTVQFSEQHWAQALDRLIQQIVWQRCLFLNLYCLMDDYTWQAHFKRFAKQFVHHYFGQRYFNKVKAEYLLFFEDALCWQFQLWFQGDLNGELTDFRKKLDTFQLLEQVP